jgi:hypothetical protein
MIQTGAIFDPSAVLPGGTSVMEELLELPSLAQTYEPNPDYGATVVGGFITQIASQRPSSEYVLQPTGANRPALLQTPGYAAGKPLANFDGANDYLQESVGNDLTKAHSFAIVFRTDAPSVDQVVISSFQSSGVAEFLQIIGATQKVRYQVGNRNIDLGLLGGFNLAVCGSNGDGQLRMWLNGLYREAAPGGDNAAPTAVQRTIGALNSAAVLPFDGQVAWYAEFDSDIFTAEPLALGLIRDRARYDFGLDF